MGVQKTMANKMTNKAGVIAFKPNKELVRALRDLQIYYGNTTRSSLLSSLVTDSIIAVYRRKPPENMSPEQKRAYKRIRKYVRDIADEIDRERARLDESAEDDI